MPIHFGLVGDEIRVTYSGKHTQNHRAIIQMFDFAHFSVRAGAWTFPIRMFKKVVPFFEKMAEPPDIAPNLLKKLNADNQAVKMAKELLGQVDSDFSPEGFRANLLTFQKIGAQFLTKGRRVVLGDDVGLGKTVETLAAMTHLVESGEISSVLIIVPGHLKRQWAAEIAKFTRFQPIVVEGKRAIRQQLFTQRSTIFITNYDLLSRDPEYLDREWDLVILDEAQEIKNWRSQAAKITKRLKTGLKWALTATPLENNLPELHSILDFVNPGLLGGWWDFEREHIVRDLWGGIEGYIDLEGLKKKIRPYILRRRVEDCIHDFPEKETKIVTLNFLQEEGIVYRDIVKRILRTTSEKRTASINESQKMTQIGFLRQACNHSSLISPDFDYPSAKIEWLKQIVAEIKKRGDKVVIFTEWARMARIIRRELNDCPMIVGTGMSFEAKHQTVKRWQESLDLPLVATDCANVGLNLQQANWIISYEMHWNPAVMKQRTGRVHRLTQEKKVHVRLPVIRNTVEQNVLERLRGKGDLFKKVIDSLASQAQMASRHDRGSGK